MLSIKSHGFAFPYLILSQLETLDSIPITFTIYNQKNLEEVSSYVWPKQ